MSRSQELALDFLEGELARELKLRASLEQRAGGLISTYSAIVAAGLGIAALVKTDSPINEGAPLILACAGGLVGLAGLLAAVVALTPINVGAVHTDDLREMVQLAADDPDSEPITKARLEEIGNALVVAVADAQQSIKTKAISTLVSVTCLIAGLGLFASAIFVAL